MGFFADVGPLTVFVSHQVRHSPLVSITYAPLTFRRKLIHPDMKFDPNSNPPSFASDEQVIPHHQSLPRPFPSYRVLPTDHRKEHKSETKNSRYSCRCDRDCESSSVRSYHFRDADIILRFLVCYRYNKRRPSGCYRLVSRMDLFLRFFIGFRFHICSRVLIIPTSSAYLYHSPNASPRSISSGQ